MEVSDYIECKSRSKHGTLLKHSLAREVDEMVQNPTINVMRGILVDDEWTKMARDIASFCIEKYKLELPDINFHIIGAEDLYSISATDGWNVSPQHWSLGEQYWISKQQHELGLGQLYEIVVPSEDTKKDLGYHAVDAYVYDASQDYAKRLVIAHVYGHAHMFEVNPIERKFRPDYPQGYLAYAKKRLEELEQQVGEDGVERIMDISESLFTLVDWYHMEEVKPYEEEENVWEKMLETPAEKSRELKKELTERGDKKPLPEKRDYDVFKFIINNSTKVTEWEREIMEIMYNIKKRSYAGGLINIVHEGFSALINLRYALDANIPIGEVFDWLKMTYGIASQPKEVRMIGANPYWLGMNLFLDVIDRWDKGMYGLDWENLTDVEARKEFDKKINKGWEKVIEITKVDDDYSFIDNYFTEDFFKHKASHLLVYQGDKPDEGEKEEDTYMIVSQMYKDVKNALLFNKFNNGLPRIFIPKNGGDYDGLGHLMLVQDFSRYDKLDILQEELTLDLKDTYKTMMDALYPVWGKPVHLITTTNEGQKIMLSTLDGIKVKITP